MAVENWFEDSRQTVVQLFGDDADLFFRLLAATSPIADIRCNVLMACRAYQHLKWFGKIQRGGFINTHYITLGKFLADIWTEAVYNSKKHTMGRKVWSLYQNLIGNEQVCPIDRWMLRYFGHNGDTRVTPELYDVLEGKIKAEAAEMGVTPAKRQVAIWCQMRSNGSTRGSESYGDVLRRQVISRDNLLRRLL